MKAGKRGAIAHRHKFLFGVFGAVALVLIGITIGFAILLSGGFSTAATTQHFAVTHRLLDLGLRISVNARADDIDAPNLDNAEMRRRGSACYRMHCEQCHGAPAVAPAAEGRGMLPVPANLAESPREWSPSALYYITKNGIRMTGMPAWEFRMSEQSLWDTVAFVTALSELDETSYRQLHADPQSLECEANKVSPVYTSDERGDVLLRQYACHSCHRIDRVTGPKTFVGPPLMDWANRKYIAGVLPNTHENLVKWIQSPQSVDSKTLMPNLNVPAAHANEMATFLLEPT
jgi:mono/diheme cytochrome c family protein/cytochrome c551/c552